MDLILALIFGSYYSCRRSIDNYELKSCKARIESDAEDRFSRRDAFIAKYSDETLEDNLREVCVNKSGDYKRVEDLLLRSYIEASQARVLMMMMAECGKVPHKYLEKGICNILIPPDYTKQKKIEAVEEFWKFIKLYYKYCKNNGINEHFYFSPNVGYTKHERWELEDSDLYDITHYGVFVWEPMDISYPEGASISIDK